MVNHEDKPGEAIAAGASPGADDGTPAISAQHLRRSFGPVLAVADVSLAIPRGAIAALVGPNGSGKTTLLLLLAGLLRPDAGSCTVAGFDPQRDNLAARSRIGWMPDVFGTWDCLTVSETLTTVAAAYGMDPASGQARAGELLALIHLGEFADTQARVLSRGQKQRLGLARALVHRPSVLLLDEPASGLDPRSRIELRDLLRDLAAGGTTVVVSSHVLSELDEVADHVVFLSRGEVTSEGPMAALRSATQAEVRLGALDPDALRRELGGLGLAWRDDPAWPGGVIVRLSGGQEATAGLVASLVGAGVQLHTAAALGSSLELAYLAQDQLEERA